LSSTTLKEAEEEGSDEPDKSRIRSEELRLKTEKNLAEISEKLNRLIGPR
jgi:hypothetical protein